jgi:hypothetical protein
MEFVCVFAGLSGSGKTSCDWSSCGSRRLLRPPPTRGPSTPPPKRRRQPAARRPHRTCWRWVARPFWPPASPRSFALCPISIERETVARVRKTRKSAPRIAVKTFTHRSTHRKVRYIVVNIFTPSSVLFRLIAYFYVHFSFFTKYLLYLFLLLYNDDRVHLNLMLHVIFSPF